MSEQGPNAKRDERPGARPDAQDTSSRFTNRLAAMPSRTNGTTGGSPTTSRRVDPVRVRRAKIAKWTLLANRVGYLLFGVAMAVFFIGFGFKFTGAIVAIVTGCIIAGSILLAPALVIGYGVKKAEREDVARGL